MFTKLRHEEVRRILENVDLPGEHENNLSHAVFQFTYNICLINYERILQILMLWCEESQRQELAFLSS